MVASGTLVDGRPDTGGHVTRGHGLGKYGGQAVVGQEDQEDDKIPSSTFLGQVLGKEPALFTLYNKMSFTSLENVILPIFYQLFCEIPNPFILAYI